VRKILSKKAISKMWTAIIIIIILIAIVAGVYYFYFMGPAASVAGLSVSLNSPADGSTQGVNATTFTYTPVSTGDDIINASLWMNLTGTWRSVALNSTVVQNNTANSFSYTLPAKATYVWNVQVFNSTTGVFATANNTLTYHVVTGSLTIWHGLLENELLAWNQRLANFTALYPEVTVTLVSKATLHDSLATAVPANVGPDLYTWGAQDWTGEFVNSSIILPIDDYIDSATRALYYPSAISTMTYKGHLYSLPLAAECITLFYNKAFITTPPNTTDALVALMQNGSAVGGTAPYQYGLSHVTQSDPYHCEPWVSGWGGYYYNDTTGLVGMNSSGTVAAMEWFNSTILPYLAQDLGGNSQRALFYSNQSAMLISGPWSVADVKNASIDFGLATIPLISQNNNATPMPYEGVKGIWMTTNCQDANKEAAITFMKWWTGVDNQIALAKMIGWVPVVYGAYNDPDIQNDPVISGFGAQLKYTIGIPTAPQMSEVWGPAGDAWNAVTSGSQTPQQACQTAEDTITTNIITKYGTYP
jgi:arabinogalactan oligomer/maltooligosaccharide transport system substrate-binding protein